jgi:hypothetical protein
MINSLLLLWRKSLFTVYQALNKNVYYTTYKMLKDINNRYELHMEAVLLSNEKPGLHTPARGQSGSQGNGSGGAYNLRISEIEDIANSRQELGKVSWNDQPMTAGD